MSRPIKRLLFIHDDWESLVVFHVKQATPWPQQFIRELGDSSATDVTLLSPPFPRFLLSFFFFSFFSSFLPHSVTTLHLHQVLAEELEQKLSASRNRGLDSAETCQEGSQSPVPEPAKQKPTGSTFLL